MSLRGFRMYSKVAIERLNSTALHVSKSSKSPVAQYSSVTVGSRYSPEYAKYLQLPSGEIGSYFHDVPIELKPNDMTVTMVVEIPRWSNAKFEISKEVAYNPIKQDIKKGKPRFVNNIFPYHGFLHNYGAIPQTWENPYHKSVENLVGDNDPVDCCEIGSQVLQTGDIKQVKVLGSLALIDGGELDWKVIVINTEEPKAEKVNSLEDVEREFPQLLSSIHRWFRVYKVPDGKPENEYAFQGKYRDAKETMEVISECHNAWKRLVNGDVDPQSIQLLRAGSGHKIKTQLLPDTPIPSEANKWHYV